MQIDSQAFQLANRARLGRVKALDYVSGLGDNKRSRAISATTAFNHRVTLLAQ